MSADTKPESALDASEDIGSNPDPRAPISDIIAARFGRRAMLSAGAALAALAATPEAEAQSLIPRQGGPSSLSFPELRHQLAQSDAVAEGYEIQNVIRWGDPVLAGAPAFDAARVTPDAQALQFGYNNDYLDFFPLPQGSANADHGLLVVNHEYTNTNLMFPGMGSGRESRTRSNAEQTRAEAMAHGLSVIEVKRTNGVWGYVPAGPHNRRITAETAMRISGPAAGAARMKTAADPAGLRVLGTLNNSPAAIRPGARCSRVRKISTAILAVIPQKHLIRPLCAATVLPAKAGIIGGAIWIASMSKGKPMKASVSAGWWNSILMIRKACR